jgi:hypothetical protein
MPIFVLDEQRFSFGPPQQYKASDPQVEVDVFEGYCLKVGVLTIPEEATLAYKYDYPLAKTYKGKAEECTAKVTIFEPVGGFYDTWITEQIASTFEDEVNKQGAEMLQVKIYQDLTPIITADYYIVATVTATPIEYLAFPFPWAVVIPLILAVLLVVSFIFLIMQVKSIDWSKPAAAIGMTFAIAAILGAGALAIMAAKKKK